MIGTSGSPKVKCRLGGEHTIWSDQLWYRGARCSDALRIQYLERDPAARYWLGSKPEEDARQVHEHPGLDPLLMDTADMSLLGFDSRTGRSLVSITLTRCECGGYNIGGVVDREARGQGYGREALETMCRVAHHHFGIALLHARCETTNAASIGWLGSCGFDQVGEPFALTLPNGRIVSALGWQRVDATAKQRCRNLPAG
jgi:RimJ/RimL family protein N-acetyltransferase